MIIINKTSEDVTHEIVLGKTKYLYKTDNEKDYLIDDSNNKIKINISFTRDAAKNKEAIDGLKKFFTELYS